MGFMHFDESMEILNKIEVKQFRRVKRYLVDTLGYVLAEDIVADHNSPSFPTAAMDGYAVRHEDLAQGRLEILSINPAGSDLVESVQQGGCIKTFTGSLMPEGADTLIPIENVQVEGNEIVIETMVPYGFSVRAVGENYAKGDRLIAEGTTINFTHIGVMASLNVVTPWVYEKPKVAILSTGSELLELGEVPTSDAQIRSSNNYILEAIVKKYGGEPLQLGCIADNKESILNGVASALEQSDIVVTTGGVSVGDFDFVKDVIVELGCDVLFKGVRIKPGQHIMIARREDKFIIALPGFAYSSTVTALLYTVPFIAKLQHTGNPLKIVEAILAEPFNKHIPKAEFTACNYQLKSGVYWVDFQGKKSGTSAILTNMLGSTALLITTEDDQPKAVGDRVKILLID